MSKLTLTGLALPLFLLFLGIAQELRSRSATATAPKAFGSHSRRPDCRKVLTKAGPARFKK